MAVCHPTSFSRAILPNKTTFFMSDCSQAQPSIKGSRIRGSGQRSHGQLRGREPPAREPCGETPAAVMEGLGYLRGKEHPKRIRRPHTGQRGGSTCFQLAHTSLFHLPLPQAPPPGPGRAAGELAADRSSLGRLPLLLFQLFLTQIRLWRSPGSPGRGSRISSAQDKVTRRASGCRELPGTGCRREESDPAMRG